MIRSGIVSAVSAAGTSASSSALIHTPGSPAHPCTISSTIKVTLDPLSGCGACPASGGCGVQLVPVNQSPLVVECRQPACAQLAVGDRVQVQLSESGSHWLRIVALAYGSPTIGMISGALVGYWSAQALHMPQFTESFSLAGFVVGLAGGLIAWCRAEKSVSMRHDGENRLQLHKVIQER